MYFNNLGLKIKYFNFFKTIHLQPRRCCTDCRGGALGQSQRCRTVAAEGLFSSCRRSVCPVYCPAGNIHYHLNRLCIPRWLDLLLSPSVSLLGEYGFCPKGNKQGFCSYHMALPYLPQAPQSLPVRHLHGYRGLVFKKENV